MKSRELEKPTNIQAPVLAHDIAVEVVKLLEERQAFSETLDKEGAARYLHCSISKLELRMKAKAIPFARDGRTVIFRKKDLDRYLEQKLTGIDVADLLNEMMPDRKSSTRRKNNEK